MSYKVRNQVVDVIRGFAMLMVVLGHTISGTVSAYSDTLLFQVIWTLQMPLFIVISGYVTRYSKPLSTLKSLSEFIFKRTFAYMLPWFVWTIIIRGLIFKQTGFLDINNLFWHMDSGYWFLVTIWSISMIFGIADFLSYKWFANARMNVLSHLILCGVVMIGLMVFGYFVGYDFFALKLTLYYFPFYLLGYLYGKVQDWLMAKNNAETIVNCIVVVSLGLWLAAISRFNFFTGGDEITVTIGRFVTSIFGCMAVTGLISALYTRKERDGGVFLNWVGLHSLEVYLTHYLFLCLVPALNRPMMASMEGLLSLITNFILTMVLVIGTIKLVQSNRILNYLLYAK